MIETSGTAAFDTAMAPAKPFGPLAVTAAFSQALAGTPLDHFVVWTGQAFTSRRGSRAGRILALLTEPWTPVSLRELSLRAAALDPEFRPDAVRSAVRQHQGARGACYLHLRRTVHGYELVSDAPFPAFARGPLRAGARLLDLAGNWAG